MDSNTSNNLLVLRSGGLAYFDSYTNGLVPVKIVSITSEEITARVTAKRGSAYPVGWLLFCPNSGPVTCPYIPRAAVKKFRGSPFPKILPFTIEVDNE